MDMILTTSDIKEINNVTLGHPSSINAGSYFVKLYNNKKPLYIQTPKCKTKQGFSKLNKKFICDLLFESSDVETIECFENLENKCQELILQKNVDWFENSLERDDLESAFNSILKIYKSGKYYLLKPNITILNNDVPNVKVYDESENLIPYSEIYDSSEIIGILEILGIKFSARSFQIEIELKQLMKINSDKIFNNCKINTDLKIIDKKEATEEVILLNKNENNDLGIENQVDIKDLDLNEIKIENDSDNDEITKPENLAKKEEQELNIEPIPSLINDIGNTDLFEIDIGDENFNINSNQEVVEPMKLKESDEVYLELYKEAKKKAKEAKRSAIIAYLEAKNIKNTFMINTMDEDSDFDQEIEEVSESELEEFF
jgi:hypothetical protein